MSELVGRAEASKFAEGIRKVVEEVSHCIYRIMSNTLGGVQQMVTVLPTREVTQLVLDEELAKLATTTFSDPGHELLRTHYIRADR